MELTEIRAVDGYTVATWRVDEEKARAAAMGPLAFPPTNDKQLEEILALRAALRYETGKALMPSNAA